MPLSRVTNIETGATRTVTTDESGVYRFPLLPLGTYRITAEAANFKKLVREGIILTTGQTATVDLSFAKPEKFGKSLRFRRTLQLPTRAKPIWDA